MYRVARCAECADGVMVFESAKKVVSDVLEDWPSSLDFCPLLGPDLQITSAVFLFPSSCPLPNAGYRLVGTRYRSISCVPPYFFVVSPARSLPKYVIQEGQLQTWKPKPAMQLLYCAIVDLHSIVGSDVLEKSMHSSRCAFSSLHTQHGYYAGQSPAEC